MSKKILFGLVAVTVLVTFTHASQAEIRKAQVVRAEQMSGVDVALNQSDIQAQMQGREFHTAVDKRDGSALQALVGTTHVKAFHTRAPLIWDELETKTLGRPVRHVLDDDNDPGGWY